MSVENEAILVKLFNRAGFGAFRLRQPSIMMGKVRDVDRQLGRNHSFTRPKQPIDFTVNGTLAVLHDGSRREILPFRIGVEEKTTESVTYDWQRVTPQQAVKFTCFCRENHMVPVYIVTLYQYGADRGETRKFVPIVFPGKQTTKLFEKGLILRLDEIAKPFDEMLKYLIAEYIDVYLEHFNTFKKYEVDLGSLNGSGSDGR